MRKEEILSLIGSLLLLSTRSGSQWHAMTIKKILDNPIYKGQLTYKNECADRTEYVPERLKQHTIPILLEGWLMYNVDKEIKKILR